MPWGGAGTFSAPSAGGAGGGFSEKLAFPLPLGPHTVRLEYDLLIECPPQGLQPGLTLRAARTFVLPIRVVPDDEPLVRTRSDPRTAASVERGCVLTHVEFRTAMPAGRRWCMVEWEGAHHLPPGCYSVTARTEAQEIPLGSICRDPDATVHGWLWQTDADPAPLLAGAAFDLVLRPDVERAASEPGMDEIWGKPLVFRGLRLAEQADPAGEPPTHAWRGRAAAEVAEEP